MVSETYSWVIPKRYKITAEQAQNEILKLSEVTPHNIVELAKNENSPLHNEFNWNTEEKEIEKQAENMMNCIIVHKKDEDGKEIKGKAWATIFDILGAE